MAEFFTPLFCCKQNPFPVSLHLLNPFQHHTVCSQIMRGALRYVMCVRWCYLWELTLESRKNYITFPKFSSAWSKVASRYRDIHRATLICCIHIQHTLDALNVDVYHFMKYKNNFAISIISQNWTGTGSWNHSSWKTSTHFPRLFSDIVAFILGMYAARPSATIVLTTYLKSCKARNT